MYPSRKPSAPLSEYETKRNALIPQAESYANMCIGKQGPGKFLTIEGYRDAWNLVFHRKMNQLAVLL